MIKGKGTLTITHDTLCAALQYYFERETFAPGACPRIDSVVQCDSYSNETFDVKISASQDAKAADAAEQPSK